MTTLYLWVVRSTNATFALFEVAITKSADCPSGSTEGKKWPVSPAFLSGGVITRGSPPAAGTRRSPTLVAKTMVLSAPQLAPRGFPWNLHTGIAGPPGIGVFF